MRHRDVPLGSPRRRHLAAVALLVVGGSTALLLGTVWAHGTALERADGRAILVLVDDGHGEEARADAIVLAQWFRGCDALSITSIPRDLVLRPGGEPVAVLHHTIGPVELGDRVEEAFDVSLLAVSVIDVTDVEGLASKLGPVRIDLPAESRDRRSGFHGGPGPVELTGADAVTYLRSRVWEELRGSAWVVTDTSDLGRIARLHDYLEAVAETYGNATLVERLGLALDGLRSSEVSLRDPVGAVGIALGASSHSRLSFRVPEVVEERSLDDRRSPFDPDDLGSAYRLVLTEPGRALPTPCTGDGGP